MAFRQMTLGLFLFGLASAPLACSDDDDASAPGAGGESGSPPAAEGGSSELAGGSSGVAGGEGGTAGEAPVLPGALIRVTLSSTVGVLLDEIPESMRERVAEALLEKPEAFFVERARRQLSLASYRLNFRRYFYEEAEAKQQLPLPPEQAQRITLVPDESGNSVRRDTFEGHDYVLADYELEAVVVTDSESPAASEPALSEIGGTWDEPFVFPVDPELLIQRTGYACMDEAQFPVNSVDSENVEFFYDQECEVEEELSPDGCHGTVLPTESCEDALSMHVGKVDTALQFERIEWDEQTADENRVGQVTTEGAADLQVVSDELLVNRLIYRYIPADSCALVEACVGGPGWRRLLQFNASEKNVGSAPIDIGDIDYFIDDPSNPTPNANHHVFQYSACHNHYHFNYFATFTYGGDPDLGSKRAFCLESVKRYSNHEQSPTWSPYDDCSYQGITQGWGDQYNAGIECQWVDVTTVDTSGGPVTRPLGLLSNPEGFLCEGTPVLDGEGNVTWEETDLVTDEGEPVDRPVCTESSNWDANNYDEQDVTPPVPGEGLLTSPCERGQIGPRRNCGFTYDGGMLECTPGETVSLRCSAEDGAAPQVVRLCEASTKLGAGVACMDAEALASDVLDGDSVSLSFPCPLERDAEEPGGKYSTYYAPVWPEDQLAAVTCTVE
jgi:hypothetical protein